MSNASPGGGCVEIMMEYHNQYAQCTDWTAFVYGSIAGSFSGS